MVSPVFLGLLFLPVTNVTSLPQKYGKYYMYCYISLLIQKIINSSSTRKVNIDLHIRKSLFSYIYQYHLPKYNKAF